MELAVFKMQNFGAGVMSRDDNGIYKKLYGVTPGEGLLRIIAFGKKVSWKMEYVLFQLY